MREWINEVPNEGLVRFTTVFNQERLLVTSPEALGEVLVGKSYDWEKPAQMIKGLRRILGEGVLLAGGNAHKVCYFISSFAAPVAFPSLFSGSFPRECEN